MVGGDRDEGGCIPSAGYQYCEKLDGCHRSWELLGDYEEGTTWEDVCEPDCPENPEELDEETQELLTSDFEIGHYIRERILPRAVLFFTGEALEDDDYDDEEEEEDEDDDDEDGEEEEEEDPDFDPEKAKKQQECKQQ